MNQRPSGIRNTVLRRLAEESGLLRQFAILRENQAELQQQSTSLQQQIAALQQQIAVLDTRILPEHIPNLDFPFRFSARQMVNELTGASQGVQNLLSLYYLDLARRGGRLPDLGATEFRSFSQNGEDGLLLYVFSVVGTTNKKALEICAGDGIECNTANLIINHSWTGLLFDGDDQNVKRSGGTKATDLLGSRDVVSMQSLSTRTLAVSIFRRYRRSRPTSRTRSCRAGTPGGYQTLQNARSGLS